MSKIALVIIYNHQYNKNIDILEDIYENRFSNIYHLVPFYTGVKSNVISVYDSSYYFQGYVAQGYKSFFKEEFTHYIFIGDDLLLNPLINENNYTEHFMLRDNSCFIPELLSLHNMDFWWNRTKDALHYNVNIKGVEANDQIPTYEVALERFSKFGLEIQPLHFEQIWKVPSTIKQWGILAYQEKSRITHFIKNKISNKKYHLSYPLVGGYSDIFVVSSETLKQFCHFSGVFSATRLFVEIAIPTAMVLTAEEIITEKDLKLQGKPLWTVKDFEILEKYNNNLKSLLDDFPSGLLYLHPIKLSKWNKVGL
jgi:hypothetical protein